MTEPEHDGHSHDDHAIAGSPNDQARRLIARHLCGWISGHGAPVDHFLADADLIMAELINHGLRVHKVGATSSASDGFVDFELRS